MWLLLLMTVVWSFSFSLIGVYLAGHVDGYFSVLARVALASLMFLPLLRITRTPKVDIFKMMVIGALQIGLMYLFYYQAFEVLSVPEVLLFTIFTPLYITLFDDALRRRFSPVALFCSALAVCGALLISHASINPGFWHGFLLVQICNVCFAVGQVAYRRWLPASAASQTPREAMKARLHCFGWFYIGALVVVVPAYLWFGNMSKLPNTPVQWSIILWLGLIASGVGYFAWNEGARQVDAGTLAVMNELLKPMGLAVNVLIWNRDADMPRLLGAAAIIVLALLINLGWQRRRAARLSEQ